MMQLGYLVGLLAFAFGRNPLLYLSLALSLFSVVVELAAMGALFPLSEIVFGRTLSPSLSLVGGGWVVRGLDVLGIAANLKTVSLVFLTALLLRLVTLMASQGLILFIGKRLHAQISSLAFGNIVRDMPIRAIEEKSIGHYVSLAGDESFRASNLVIAISQFAGVAALGGLYFVAIAYFSPSVAIAVVAFLALSYAALFTSFRKSHRLGAVQLEQSRLSGSIFLDALNGLRAVRAMSAEEYVVNRYRSEIFRYVGTLFRADFIALLARLVPVAVLLGLGIMFLATSDTVGATLDGAFVFAMLVYLLRFFPVVGQTLNLFMRIVVDAKAGQNVLEATRTTASPTGAGVPEMETVRTLAVRDLSFAYSPGKCVLENLNLEFSAGRSDAIMGPSGSGKSTLLDLILGFHDPDAGDVLVNGASLKHVERRALRHRVLLLGQQTTVFNDTVFDNIALGLDVSAPVVMRAGRLAHLEEFVAQLDDGYESRLAYQGANLSGGQRQRIGIARALVRDPDVLILDESFSALDRQTVNAIVAPLLQAYRDRIVIVVTHDRELAEMTDEIIQLGHA